MPVLIDFNLSCPLWVVFSCFFVCLVIFYWMEDVMSFPCWLWAIFVSLPHYFKLLEEEFTLCPLRYLQGLGHQEDMELDNWHDLSGNSK